MQSPSPIMVLTHSADIPRPEEAQRWAAVRTTPEQAMHWNLRGMPASSPGSSAPSMQSGHPSEVHSRGMQRPSHVENDAEQLQRSQ